MEPCMNLPSAHACRTLRDLSYTPFLRELPRWRSNLAFARCRAVAMPRLAHLLLTCTSAARDCGAMLSHGDMLVCDDSADAVALHTFHAPFAPCMQRSHS